jgi:NADPH-dependent 2,4-dienoyl-CoA reductase/sulfur reductase-like enzyme
MPKAPAKTNGRRVALVGAGPASLTVARDLAPLGNRVVIFDGDSEARDLHDHAETVEQPLNALGEAKLISGNEALQKLNASLR